MIFIHRNLTVFLLNILFSTICIGQKFKDPGEFLSPGSKDSLPKIFLVGTIHFEYYNADAYKVSKDKQIDILSDQKQEELKQLLDYISLFKPNKILVEAKPEWNEMKNRDLKQTLETNS